MKNALLWGMCQSHFHQVQIQSQLSSRIVHLVLAIIEAIPIIGQLVSLIELKIVQLHIRHQSALNIPKAATVPSQESPVEYPQPSQESPVEYPQPSSCIPQIATVASQESPADVRRLWPIDLKLLGLTTAQKKEVDSHVRDAFRAIEKGGTLSFDKKRLKYSDGTHTVDAALPITLSIYKDDVVGSGFRVLLFPKTIFTSGGERKIRWVYDLTTGNFLLKKRITGLFEEKILKSLAPLRAARGIQASVVWRTSLGKQKNSKLQIIEPVRDGTLPILFGTDPLSNFPVKLDLIIDLLNDLKDLHTQHLSGVKLSASDHSFFDRTPEQVFSYSHFHSDIKPSNVLVFSQNDKWRAELCDFGASASNPTAFVISVGFTPPEYISFYKKKRPFGIEKNWFDNDLDVIQFNIKHGQGRDVWGMGLVIISLLVEREEEVVWENVFENCHKKARVSPLPCLKAILSSRLWDHYDEKGIMDLKQKTIDADLDQLEHEIAPKHPENQTELARVFEMLKGMMRVNPEERKTISQCLAFLQQES